MPCLPTFFMPFFVKNSLNPYPKLRFKHDETFSTLYSHLKSISVQVGDNLKKGQVIGYVGSTGLATAPHLHYEVFKDGKNVNPIDYLPE